MSKKRDREEPDSQDSQGSQGSQVSGLGYGSASETYKKARQTSNCESFVTAMSYNGVTFTDGLQRPPLKSQMELQELTRHLQPTPSVFSFGSPSSIGSTSSASSVGSASSTSSVSVASVKSTTSVILQPGMNEISEYESRSGIQLIGTPIIMDNIDRHIIDVLGYIQAVNTQPLYGGGKRKRRYMINNKHTMKRRGKLITGGSIPGVVDWLCAHADFVAGAILLSFVGGGFWCLGSYIIPVAMSELKGAVWNYIVKVCETTAVVITNLFKTQGGVSKFIDLIVNSYMGLAVVKQAGIDAFDKLIRPPFCQIRDIIKAWCASSEDVRKEAAEISLRLPPAPPAPPAELLPAELPPAQLPPAPQAVESLVERIINQVGPVQQVQGDQFEANPQALAEAAEAAKAGRIILDDALRIIPLQEVGIDEAVKEIAVNQNQELAALPQAIRDQLSRIEQQVVGINAEEVHENAGGNILSYLAKKIKKTMKRRKHSHKKRAKKNIHYKSHKKNKR
jgi:hypothetical protein